jgi:hypothetical protein
MIPERDRQFIKQELDKLRDENGRLCVIDVLILYSRLCRQKPRTTRFEKLLRQTAVPPGSEDISAA